MKKNLLKHLTMLALVLCGSTVFAQLSGTYSIDPSGSGNYTSFTAAVSDLNSNGVNGDVTFIAKAGTYSNNFTITAFSGSGSYDVVFKGASKTTTIVTSSTYTVSLNGCDRVTFRDMTLRGTGSGSVVRTISNGCDDISFRNCALTGTTSSTSSTYAVVRVYTTNSNLISNRWTFDSCAFTNGGYTNIYFYSSSTSYQNTALKLLNSTFQNYSSYGTYIYRCTDPEVINCEFKGTTRSTTSYGCYLSYCTASSAGIIKVNNNRITGPGYLAFYINRSTGGSTALRGEFINNTVEGKFTYTGSQIYPAYFYYSNNWKIYHNSLAGTTHAGSGNNYGILSLYNCNGLDIANNTLIGYKDMVPLRYYVSSTSYGQNCSVDYNNYYNTDGTGLVTQYATGTYTRYTSSNFTSGIGGSNSKNVHQGWTSLPDDLSIKDGCVNGTNKSVSTDVKGKTRSNPPDIGAYEASSANDDIGITEILTPQTPLTSGSQTVKVTVKNYGANSVSQLRVNYKVGTSSPVSEAFGLTTSLGACDSRDFTMSTGFSVTSGCHDFEAYTTAPNGNSDAVTSNDTAKSKIGVGMSGTFSVYGSGADFANLDAAFDAMKCGGVAGNVILNVAAGTYTGQVDLPEIVGTSSSARIIINGAGKDSTFFKFGQTSSSGHRYVMRLNQCSWVEVRNMTIQATGSSYAWTLNFNGTKNCSAVNCNFISPTSTSSNVDNIVLGGSSGTSYSSGGPCENTTIDSCTINGGYFGIVAYGQSASMHDGTILSNTHISNYRYYGAYFYYCSRNTITNNNIEYGNYNYQYVYGLYVLSLSGTSVNGPHNISNNEIKSYGYGAYIYYLVNDANNKGKFINNMIVSSNPSYGIRWYGNSSNPNRNWKVYNNSLNLTKQSSYGWYFYYTDSLDFQNNIINMSGGGSYCIYYSGGSAYSPNGTTMISDYNNFYGTSNLGYYNGSTRTASNLNSSSSYDQNSMSIMTPFKSSEDLHLTDACFARGASLTDVTEDIDGDSRSSSGPHIGCDEVQVAALDAGVSEIVSPVGQVSSGSQTVEVAVRNYGTTAISSVTVYYQVGSGSPVSQTFTLSPSLQPCSEDTVTFTTGFSHTKGCEELKAWTSRPNSSTDALAVNDTNSGSFGIPMNGAYTLGGSSSDFGSFAEALAGLNCAGISGPVVINVASGTYTEQVKIGAIAGSSSTNTVTFRSAASNSTNPLLSFGATASDKNYVVGFEEASYVVFDGIDMKSTGASFANAIELKNSNSDITIQNSVLSINPSTSGYGVYNQATSTSVSRNISILNNTFNDPYYGIYNYASSSSYTTSGWKVNGNTFNQVRYYGSYHRYSDGVEMNGNIFDMKTGNGYMALYFYYCDGQLKITKNKISGQSYGYGIYHYYCYATSSAPSLIANNFVSVGNGTSYVYSAFRSGYSRYTHIYNNSFLAYPSSSYTTSTSYSAVSLYYTSSTYAGNEFKNNIVYRYGGGYALYYSGSTHRYLTSDYNDLYNGTTLRLCYAGGQRNTLANFTAYTSSDANSLSTDPEFYSTTDLHATSSALDSAGTALSSVTDDIDGQTRRAANPSMGADEYTALDHDASILSILGPSNICATNTASVQLGSFGNLTMTSCTINWSINGTVQTPYSWNGTLTKTQSTSVDIGTFNAPSGTGLVELIAWTSNPNSNTDLNPDNDTSSMTTGRGIKGTFTIGGSGSDFPTFNAALDAMALNGICGDVVFNVASGDYNEQLKIDPIAGTSPNATVTFQAAASNTTPVTLKHAIVGNSDNYIVYFNGASFITFDGINMENTGTSTAYTRIIDTYRPTMEDRVRDISIKNAKLLARSVNTTSTVGSVVYLYYYNSASTSFYNGVHNFTFDNCDFMNGSYGIYASAQPTGGNEHKNIMVNNCRVSNPYYYGMYFYYSDTTSINNCDMVIGNTTNYSTCYGLNMQYCDGGLDFNNNSILAKSGTSTCYGTYMRYVNGGITADGNNIVASNGSNTHGSYLQYCGISGDTNVWTNNFFSAGNSGSTKVGFNCWYSSPTYFFHNNCYSEGGSSANNNSTAAFLYGTSTSHGPYFAGNNNFQVAKSSHQAAWIYNTSTGIYADYNNYYPLRFVENGYQFTAFAAAQSFFGTDSNSVSLDPCYTATTDLHVNNANLHETGLDVGVTIDIDSVSRDMPPTIGADEINPDLSIVSVSVDTACGHDRINGTVTVTIKNEGDIILKDIPVSLRVDGHDTTDVVAGPIAIGATGTFVLPKTIVLAGMADYNVSIWATMPTVDPSGDTASTTIPYWPYPMSSFTVADTCFKAMTKFTNTSTISRGTIAGSSWTFGDGGSSTDMSPTHQYATNGSYMAILTSTSANGCTDMDTVMVNSQTELIPGSISADQTICYDFAPAALTSTADATQSAGTYSYQWQSSSDNTNWSDISGATSNNYAPGQLTSTTYYRRGVTTSIGCGPAYTSSVKITVYDKLVAGSIGSEQDICYNTAPTPMAHATAPTGGDGTWTYAWERSTDNSSWSRIAGATANSYTVGKLKTTTYFRRIDIGGSGCGEVATASIKVNVYNPVNGGVAGPSHESCPNTIPNQLGSYLASSGGDGVYTYQWEMSTDKTNWSTITGATSETYQHGVLSTTTHFRRLTTSGSGCGSNYSAIATVSMAAVPTASFVVSNHCFNDVMPLTNFSKISKGSITKYTWDMGDGTSSTIKAPQHVYSTDGVKTIRLKVESNIGCLDSTTKTVKVSNIPTPAFSYLYDCNVDSLKFKNTTSVNCGKINAFHWDFGDGNSSTLQNPVHTYATPGTYNVKMKIFLPGGFEDSLTRTITQYERSTAGFTVQDVCFGENVQFNNSSTHATAYEWDFDDNNLSKLAGPAHFYRVIGTYNVKLRAYDGNGCYDEATAKVTVKVKPVAYFTTDNRCDGDDVPFFNGTTYANSYIWDFGDSKSSTTKDPKHLYSTYGNYDVTLYAFNTNGCKDTTFGKVEVYNNPSASFTGTNACDGQKVTFNNTSTVVNKYNWTFGDGQTSTTRNPSHVYAKAGTYSVGLGITTTEGCSDNTTQSITVYDNPVADFSTSDVCHGSATSFTNNSTLALGTMTYSWDFGDGNSSSAENPSHTYANAGTYTVELTVTAPGGCVDVMTKTVKVNVQPTSSFTATTECEGTATSFTNASSNATSYAWDFGDGNGSSMSDPKHTYTSAGSYVVTLKTMHSGGCSSSSSQTVTVNAVPVASISANTVCQGTATAFGNNSSVASGTMTYSWDFGDGNSSTSAAPSHIYANAGTYVAILTASANGCSDKASVSVKVNANPIVDFKSDNVCVGNTTSFTNLSTGAANYTWNFGDASSSTSIHPTHKYGSANTYTVQLTGKSTEGCTDSKSASVVVYATPTVGFSQSDVCVGTGMTFSNSSSSGTSTWDFGDGYTSTSTIPTHTYKKSGKFNVTLEVTNAFGCSAQLTKAVTVYAEPSAGFTASDVCQGSSVAFNNTSTGASTYAWDFGDSRTSTSANPTHLYATSGTYTVSLVATSSNGCKNSYSSKVSVNANPTATFVANSPCLGQAVNFINSSSTGTYSWNFGDGSVSTAQNPSHNYTKAGTYTVVLTVTNSDGCSTTLNRSVKVSALPTASFTSKAECTGPEASFTNTSTGGSSYAWSFGDGTSSTSMSPNHMYANSGSYTVKLVTTNSDGCKASAENLVTVFNSAKADFSAAGVCSGSATLFNNMSTGAVSSSWNFGDGNSSTDVFPSHTYAAQGSYNVTLEVKNGIGCVSNTTKSVSVYANPTASFTAANGCEGDELTFTNTSTGAANSTWNYGDGNTSVGTDGVHTYSVNGDRTITLSVVSTNGCKDETSQTITVYERPFAAFIISNTCEGDLTRFTNTSLNGASFNWMFGDGNTSSIKNPTHQYAGSGSYTASLTVNNANCSDTYNMPFDINAAPDAGFTFSQAGRDVNFTANAMTNVSTYEWDFNDGTKSNEANPAHSYNKAIVQNFNVCLRVTDVNGCADESCSEVSIDILGANDLKLDGFAVYPNPTTGQLNINVGQINGDIAIELIDMVGNSVRTVSTQSGVQNYSIDISDLAEGVYLIKVNNGQFETTERVILSK